jgi:5S rRNA maturation endonuclease (ribonuclease M5)/KaiC/GvpD/RAD55 family RecA-like ATPase
MDVYEGGSGSRAEYAYRDSNGDLLYIKRRHYDKRFEFDRTLDNLPNVMYNLPTVIKAVGDCKRVVVVEGEKDADRLAELGITATCTRDGSSGSLPPDFTRVFDGADVLIIADRDEPGFRYATRVYDALKGVAREVRVVQAHPDVKTNGADISDHLDADFRLGDLVPVKQAGPVTRDLTGVKPERISWLWHGWVPQAAVTIVDGDPGTGKSTITLDLAARISRGLEMPDGSPGTYGNVLLISAEDDVGSTILGRLKAAGANVGNVRSLQTISEGTKPDGTEPERAIVFPQDLDAIKQVVRELGARLVVIDPLMAFLGDSVDSYRDQEMRSKILYPLKLMASELGCSIVVVRHLTKMEGGKASYRGSGRSG